MLEQLMYFMVVACFAALTLTQNRPTRTAIIHEKEAFPDMKKNPHKDLMDRLNNPSTLIFTVVVKFFTLGVVFKDMLYLQMISILREGLALYVIHTKIGIGDVILH